ncbi:hypothetical protein Tco_1183041 [Tanacetum coccineum]
MVSHQHGQEINATGYRRIREAYPIENHDDASMTNLKKNDGIMSHARHSGWSFGLIDGSSDWNPTLNPLQVRSSGAAWCQLPGDGGIVGAI